MRPKFLLIALLSVLCVSVAVSLNAQTQPATGQATSAPPQEHRLGAYVAAGSIEAGYRFNDVSGAQFPCLTGGGTAGLCNYTGAYDTFVDEREGPRVFEQTLSLRSVGQAGVLFDNLFLSSFGWGGDPENVARLRVGKRKAYDFSVLFRRDYQRFDYNLLANPLNPSSSVPNLPVLNSPHAFDTVRRMTDVNLTLAPQAPISVRLGYNRNRVEGPSFSTFHMPRGTDIQPTQNWNNTNNGFRAGVDLKFIPRTTLSFDGIVNWFKNDTFLNLGDFPFTVGGIPTNLGISWNTLGGAPCAATVGGPFVLGAVNPLCNQGTFFTRQDRYRSTMPSVSGALVSNYWRRLDINLRGTYSWGDMDSTFFQDWLGVTGTGRRQTTVLIPHVRRISSSADAGLTLHLTDNVRLSNTFRFVNVRLPGLGSEVQSTFPNTPGGVLDPLGVPVVSGLGFDRGLFDNRKINETSLEIDLARYVGFHVGYRYTHRTIELLGEGFDIDPVTGDRTSANEPEAGFQNYKLPEHTALGGLWIQPSGALRFMFDAELSSAGVRNHTFDPGEGGEIATDFDVTGITTFTRITPRHQQQYRGRVTLQPERHVNLGASVNILEARNSLSDIAYRFHNRYYSFNAGINPNDRILVDLAYSYQDYLQNDLICFSYGTRGAITPGTTPGLLTPGDCPQSGGLPAVTSYLGAIGDYDNQSHFGSVMLRVKPVSRLTLSAGYSIISNNGGFTRLNALTPTGPTQFNYHRPLAAVEIELLGGLALKGSYNYYGYNEKGSSADVFGSGGPTIPRDFHANNGTIGLRYTF